MGVAAQQGDAVRVGAEEGRVVEEGVGHVGRDTKCAPPNGKVSQGLTRIRVSRPGLGPRSQSYVAYV